MTKDWMLASAPFSVFTMKSMATLWAISDLHVGHRRNREALLSMDHYAQDWLILGGDVCEKTEDLAWVFEVLTERFAKLVWVPGNHELWTVEGQPDAPRGEAKYRELVELCRSFGVASPEDPFPVWRGDGNTFNIVPMFLLYDYTFRPDSIAPEDAVAWAAESGIVCADEHILHPDPFPSRPAWCAARVEYTRERLQALCDTSPYPNILVNHFPLREELAFLPRVPRFKVWCGTRATENWHRDYRASVVVSGHLHIRHRIWIDGVRFEEVSLGYPKQWLEGKGVDAYLRQILPAPCTEPLADSRPIFIP